MKTIQHPRGTTEEENAVTGAEGQLRVDLERHEIRLHDGVKQGGHRIANVEYIDAVLQSGGSQNQTGVVQLYGTVAELKAAPPVLNVLAILREEGKEDAFVWNQGAGDAGDVSSDISGHWKRLDSESGLAIMLWRAGVINLQIGGTEPVANQSITAWLQNDAIMLWDGTDYLAATPTLWMRLFASVGGYYTGSLSLPDRIAAQSFEIANLNTVVESGWYKSAAAATGAPVAGVHSFEHRELTSGIAIQIFHPHNHATRNYWVRYRTAVTPTWTSWAEVAGALPSRLAATSVEVANANDMTESGWYIHPSGSGGSNGPVSTGSAIYVVRHGASYVTQLAISWSGLAYFRSMNGGVWGGWQTISVLGHTHDDRYYTESEVNALLAGKANSVHNHDDRYYTEAEVNSLLNAKMGTDPNFGLGTIAALGSNGGSEQITGQLISGSLLVTSNGSPHAAGSHWFGGAVGGTWRFLGYTGNIGGNRLGLYQRVS